MLQTTQTNPAAIARRPDTAGPLAVATPTTRRLADASTSRNTRRAYLGALARLDAWRGTAPVDDASLAVYLGEHCYDLSINRYKEVEYEAVEYDPPKVILERLAGLEEEITRGRERLEGLLG